MISDAKITAMALYCSGRRLRGRNSLRVRTRLTEQSNRSGVKMTMKRAGLFAILLTPTVLLIAATSSLVSPVDGLASSRPGSPRYAAGNHRHDSSNAICYSCLDPASRRSGRRIIDHSGPAGGFPQAVAHFPAPVQQPDSIAQSGGETQTHPGLAQCWQFKWRTALNPRAPSSLS